VKLLCDDAIMRVWFKWCRIYCKNYISYRTCYWDTVQ